LCLLFAGTTASADAFLSRDQNPLLLIHGLPFVASARITPRDSLEWSLSYNITNTLNSESNATESLLLDYESHELDYSLSIGLAQDWAFRLDIPLIHYGGGFLDNAIDGWHEAFGLPQANRPNVADNGFHIRYLDNSNTVVDIVDSSSGIGDIQLGLGRQLHASADHASSVWLTADLPTGNQRELTGSEHTDFILQLASAHKLHSDWQLDASLALVVPGDSQLNGVEVADTVWFAHTGLEWNAHRAFALRVQLNGHTDIYPDSSLKLLGSSYLVVFGGRIHLDDCADFDIAISEDLKVGASPDASFIFSYRQRTGCN
jgi:hypothetical protein